MGSGHEQSCILLVATLPAHPSPLQCFLLTSTHNFIDNEEATDSTHQHTTLPAALPWLMGLPTAQTTYKGRVEGARNKSLCQAPHWDSGDACYCIRSSENWLPVYFFLWFIGLISRVKTATLWKIRSWKLENLYLSRSDLRFVTG